MGAAEQDDPLILPGGVLLLPVMKRIAGFIFQTAKEVFIKARHPLVEGLACDAKMPGGQRDVQPVPLPEDDPLQPAAGRPCQTQEAGRLPPAVVTVPQPVAADDIAAVGGSAQPGQPPFFRGVDHTSVSEY